MAKLSLIEREKKRAQLVAKYAKKYAELKAAANDAKKSDEERYASRLELQKLPEERISDAPAQALRHHRSPARHLPQVRPRSQQDS